MYYKKSLRIKNKRRQIVKHLWPLNLDYFLCPLWKLPTEKDGKRSQIPIPTEPPWTTKKQTPKSKIGQSGFFLQPFVFRGGDLFSFREGIYLFSNGGNLLSSKIDDWGWNVFGKATVVGPGSFWSPETVGCTYLPLTKTAANWGGSVSLGNRSKWDRWGYGPSKVQFNLSYVQPL